MLMNKAVKLFFKFCATLRNEGLLQTAAKFYHFTKYAIRKKYLKYGQIKPRPSSISFLQRLSRVEWIARNKALELIGPQFDAAHNSHGNYVVIEGAELDFSGQQVALVAHWDPEDIVDPYVKYLCRHFKEIGKKVILCSANQLSVNASYLEWADAILCRRCPGYDFTSWKAAMEAFPSLYAAEELTLCNDSVFAPVGSYAPVYDAMAPVKCDFWGMTSSRQEMPHLQSFHLVLKKRALSHKAVKQFFSAVVCHSDRNAAIDFELRLGLWLELHGLQPAAFVPFFRGANRNTNPSINLWEQLIDWGCPIFKREQLSKGGKLVWLYDWWAILQKHGYPVEYITAYYYRLGIDISSASCIGRRASTCPPNIMLQQKDIVLPDGKPLPTSLAVLIHCYYAEAFHYLSSYLLHVPRWAHLFVSTDSDEKANILSDELRKMGFANVDVRVFPNAGWDIAPFVVGFKDVILQYSLILKIHVKMSTNQQVTFSQRWRNLLYDSLIGDQHHLSGILRLFESDPTLGMLAPPTFLEISEISQGVNRKNLEKLLQRMDIPLEYDDAIDFPVGSMFWARSEALKPLLDIGLTSEDFEKTNPNMRDGTLAHAVERSFFFSCYKAGFAWGRVPPAPYRALRPIEICSVQSQATSHGGAH